MDLFINKLERALKNPLPGVAAQHKMAHAVRKSYPQPDHNARKACVLLLIYPKDDQKHIVLIQRMSSDNKNDKHSGQVSFPGGKLEKEDKSLLDCAMREAQEEVGINPDEIKAIGELTKLFIPVSNFLVFPFVAYIDKTPHFVPQPSEVKGILEVPISKCRMGSNRNDHE